MMGGVAPDDDCTVAPVTPTSGRAPPISGALTADARHNASTPAASELVPLFERRLDETYPGLREKVARKASHQTAAWRGTGLWCRLGPQSGDFSLQDALAHRMASKPQSQDEEINLDGVA
jgi:hypothetical protein